MKIYGFPLSPFVRKVHVFAAEKGVPIETVPVNPREPAADFLQASPFRKIPALRDGDYTLADSTAIVTYIEALHPEPPLLPPDPQRRGKAVWFEEFADTILTASGAKIVFNRFVGPRLLGLTGNEEAAQQGEEELGPILAYLEQVAPAEGWLAGDYSIADISVASTLMTLSYVGWGTDAEKRPATAAWYKRVVARPAWREIIVRETRALQTRVGIS